MKAKTIDEAFKRNQDPKETLGIGYSKRVTNSKAWAVLKFIQSKGKEGVSFTEIQKFIFTLNNPDDDFYEKDEYGMRKSRGYYATNLYGTSGGRFNPKLKSGLLTTYCSKNEKGNWVLDHMPEPRTNIY